MTSQFEKFQDRLKDLRQRAEEFADKDDINKSLDVAEKAWVEAAKAAKLMECEPVAAALGATQRSADVLAFNVLWCDTSKVSPEQLMASVVKFQALQQIKGAFEPMMAMALEESATASVLANEIEAK